MGKPDGGSAFPTLNVYEGFTGQGLKKEVMSDSSGGMTLRDWFAGKALQGNLTAGAYELLAKSGNYPTSKEADAAIAKSCYLLADAMIAEREK